MTTQKAGGSEEPVRSLPAAPEPRFEVAEETSSAAPDVIANRVSWILGAALVASLAVVVVQVLSHFASALTWAVILAVSLWPVHRAIRARLQRWPTVAAFVTMLLVTLGLIVPLATIAVLLVREIQTLSGDLRGELNDQVVVLEGAVSNLPLVGEPAREALVVLRQDTSAAVKALVGDHGEIVLAVAGQTAGAVSRTLFRLVVCLFTAFFLFLHGDSLAAQLRTAGRRVGGKRLETILQHVGLTVRAVVYGLVMTAVVQGLCAALGFWVAGVPFPWLLGALTVVLSFVPLGHAVVWVPAALYLVLESRYWAAAGLALWGAGVVASIDNVVRPIFIGVRTGIPLLLVFIGVLGGILSFGLVGLFVGPVAIAVTLALWWEWIGTPLQPTQPTSSGRG